MKQWRGGKNVSFKYAKGRTDIFGRMFHDHYEDFLLLRGNVEFTNTHTKQGLKPLQVVIIPPGEYHQFSVSENAEDYERCVIEIDPAFLPGEILQTSLAGKELLTLTESDRIIRHFFYLMNCLSQRDEWEFSHILPAVTTDLVFLIRHSTEAQQPYCGNLSPLSASLMDYINAHFTEPIDLAGLADLFFCSVSSLCHSFKKDFGISIKKYILQKRIHGAKAAIRQGEKPEEVAGKFGFTSYSTFYREYKKYLGISPSETNLQKNAHL